MSIEFIGYISNNSSSETIVRQGPILDPLHIETVAKAHENAGFDRVLHAFHSTTPDALQVAQNAEGDDCAAARIHRADAAGASARHPRPIL
jgi:alkanesulfonate monooxygenase